MKAKYLIVIITLAFFTGSSFAQKKASVPSIDQLVGISWEIAVPSNDLIDKTSLAGIRFEYRKFFSDKFSAGLAFSMNSVEQYFPTKTYEKPDGTVAVTTDMIRQAFTLPMTVIAHYYPLSGKMIKPYIGLGLGAQYASQGIFYNIYVIDHSDWGFVARPEIGTLVLFSDSFGALASVGYNYSTNKIDQLGIDNISQVCFNLGIGFVID